MNTSTTQDKVAIAKHRIIDLTDSIPDITANLIHDSQHHQLPSELFENTVFEALNDLIDDFASDPDKYLKPHHQSLLDRTAEQYLNDDFSLTSPTVNELDLPHAEYEIGSVVKVIDPQKQHTEWAVFEVVQRRYNHRCFHSTESYLSETEWYYQLASHQNGDKLIWVAQNSICAFDMSHNISTQQVF